MEEANTLSDLLNDQTARDFLAVAFLAPLAAGLVAFFSERLGVSGKIRRLEAQEKRLSIVNGLLKNADLPPEARSNLTAQLNDIATEVFAEFRPDEQDVDSETFKAGIPQDWDAFSLPRRAVFVPVPRTPLGWAVTILYYYMLVLTVTLFAGLVTGDIADSELWFGLFAFAATVFGLHRAVRFRYRKYVRNKTLRNQRTLRALDPDAGLR